MKRIDIDMFCPIHLTTITVYCYNVYDDIVLSNGCEHMHNSEHCTECCKRSIPLAKEKLATLSEFPFKKL